MLGMIPLIEKLKLYENNTLNRHLEVFLLQREKDELVLRDTMKDKVVDSIQYRFYINDYRISTAIAFLHYAKAFGNCMAQPLHSLIWFRCSNIFLSCGTNIILLSLIIWFNRLQFKRETETTPIFMFLI